MRAHYAILTRLFPGWIWALPADSGKIALTFDDGPDPETTPQLLETLARLEIRSTMFLCGEMCEQSPEIVREIAAHRHDVANHGYRHERHNFRGKQYQLRSIQRTEQLIRGCGVTPARLYRPPFGGFDMTTHAALAELDYMGVMWTAIVDDWHPQSAELLWRKLRRKLHSGVVIVLHDGHDTTETMLQILPRLADHARDSGWTFTSLSETIKQRVDES
jgi:peptidoglycan/xylan/chitin deacetylase (PgdA/CDA1 family)